MIRPILIPSKSNFETIITLDGSDYILRFLWNARCSRWFLTVRDSANNDLITARKICADIPWAPHDILGPPGQIWFVAPGNHIDPGLMDLSVQTYMLYVDEASVA